MLVVGDFNGDGLADIASRSVYLGTQDGGLLLVPRPLPLQCNLGNNTVPMATGDLDGDGKDDLVSVEDVPVDGGHVWNALVVRFGR
jgi:hypothetical protein